MRANLIAAIALAAGTASAQPISENPPTKTIQCIDVGGQSIPASCRVPGSRLDKREDICTCPAGGQRVEVAVCAKDEKPPPESKALNIGRRGFAALATGRRGLLPPHRRAGGLAGAGARRGAAAAALAGRLGVPAA